MVTMRDVAELAQVAPSTVSRVLSGSAAIRPAVRDRVLKAVADTNYEPNALGRTLRTSRTQTLGFIVPDLGAWMTTEAIRGAEAISQQLGYAMLVADSRGSAAVEADLVRKLSARRVDGVVCTPVEDPPAVRAAFARFDIPVMFLYSRPIPEADGVAIIDEHHAIATAAHRLAAFGHRHIGVLMKGTGSPFSAAAGRETSVREAFAAAGVHDATVRAASVDSEEAVARALHEMMAATPRPTALFVGSNAFMPAFVSSVREAGLRIPRDLSIVAFGDSPWHLAVDPGITSIAVDVEPYITSAVRALVDRIQGTTTDRVQLMHACRCIERGSVGPVPSSSPAK